MLQYIAKIFQSLVAAGIMALFVFVLIEGISLPRYDHWIILFTIFFFVPMAWSVVATVALWRGSEFGWVLSVCGDAVLSVFLLTVFVKALSDAGYSDLKSEMLYLLAAAVFPLAPFVALVMKSVRKTYWETPHVRR